MDVYAPFARKIEERRLQDPPERAGDDQIDRKSPKFFEQLRLVKTLRLVDGDPRIAGVTNNRRRLRLKAAPARTIRLAYDTHDFIGPLDKSLKRENRKLGSPEKEDPHLLVHYRLDGGLRGLHFQFLGELQDYDVVLHIPNGAVDPSRGQDTISSLELRYHLLRLFLPALLRTENEEIEDQEEANEQKDRTHEVTAACSGASATTTAILCLRDTDQKLIHHLPSLRVWPRGGLSFGAAQSIQRAARKLLEASFPEGSPYPLHQAKERPYIVMTD